MKHVLYILLITGLSLVSLGAQAQHDNIQKINQVKFDTTLGDSILYGYCTMDFLRTHSIFMDFYEYFYEDYQPQVDSLLMMQDQLAPLQIKIILGSWCSDSQEQVPRFIKILESLGYPPHQMHIVCVDRQKKAEGFDFSEMDIAFVPTFIFMLGEKEIGRIVESPEKTLEEDMIRIIKEVK